MSVAVVLCMQHPGRVVENGRQWKKKREGVRNGLYERDSQLGDYIPGHGSQLFVGRRLLCSLLQLQLQLELQTGALIFNYYTKYSIFSARQRQMQTFSFRDGTVRRIRWLLVQTYRLPIPYKLYISYIYIRYQWLSLLLLNNYYCIYREQGYAPVHR